MKAIQSVGMVIQDYDRYVLLFAAINKYQLYRGIKHWPASDFGQASIERVMNDKSYLT
jgi:hypothetical protein